MAVGLSETGPGIGAYEASRRSQGVNARDWFRRLIPLAIVILLLIIAACNHGPGGSGGPPGY